MSTPKRSSRPSYLFTLRIWEEVVDDDHSQWRGQLQYTLNGEKRAFRDLTSLIPLLLAMLRQIRAAEKGAREETPGPDGR